MKLDLTPPNGWNILPLSRIITGLRGGVSVNGTDLPARNGEPGVLKLSAISYEQFAPEQNKAVLENERSRLGPSVRGNTILISRSNTTELVGACVYVPKDFPYLYLSDLIWEIEVAPANGNSAKWLSYMLSSEAIRSSLMARAAGTSGSMKKLSMAALKGIKIWQPPLPEQECIAEIVMTWDRAIGQTEKLIEAKRNLKNGLRQQLLAGKRRFPGFEELWHKKKLGEVFHERKETNCTDLPLLSVTGDRGVIPHSETGRKDSSAEDKSKYKRITPGDIGYNTMRMWQGVSALSCLEGIVSPAYTICVPKKEIDGAFASHLFKFPPVVHLFYRYSQGLVSDTLNLKFPHFAQVTVELPSLSEQKKIASILGSLDREIESLVALSDRIKEQKRGLMQKLLTGLIRVKTAGGMTA